jgi:hypothetical protein
MQQARQAPQLTMTATRWKPCSTLPDRSNRRLALPDFWALPDFCALNPVPALWATESPDYPCARSREAMLDIQTILAPVADMLPAAWGDNVRLTVAAALFTAVVLGVVLLVAALLGRRKDTVAEVGSGGAAALPAGAAAKAVALHAAAPDLDPEEWVSGNVIHFDRYKAVGLIRSDRVKGLVRFDVAAFQRAPRVGEAVRFKGRHGARRRPVAMIVERLPGAKRAG